MSTFRPDERTTIELRADAGRNTSEVSCELIHKSHLEDLRARAVADSERLRGDAEDRDELAAIAREMEAIRARGDVYRLRAAKKAQSHEQTGVRHAVELQGPIKLSTVIVATLTRAALAVCRPDIDVDGRTTKVLVDGRTTKVLVAAVDGALRLGDVVRRLSAHEMTEVDLTCDSCSGRSEPGSWSQ